MTEENGSQPGVPDSNPTDPQVIEVSSDARELREAPEQVRLADRNHELDPAHRALADALRLSFRIVQGTMILLIVGFLATGARSVSEHEKGIRLTFGRMQDGDPLDPGAHLSFPAPIGEFVRIETSPRTLELSESFWPSLSAADLGKPTKDVAHDTRPGQGLVPGEDGSVITSDHNLAHTRWSVQYVIDNPRMFIRNVSEGGDPATGQSEADRLVRNAIERAVVHAAAKTKLDDVVANVDTMAFRVKGSAQQILDVVGCGITVESVLCTEPFPPFAIYEDYESVNKASTDAHQMIEFARSAASQTLNAVAGQAHSKLSLMIRIYEAIHDSGAEPAEADLERLCRMVTNPDEIRAAAEDADAFLAQIDAVLTSPEAGGEVAMIVASARQYSTSLVSKLSGETETLKAYYEQYKENPQIVMLTLWRNTMAQVMDRGPELFILPPDVNRTEIRINSDPEVEKRRQRERNTRELTDQFGGP